MPDETVIDAWLDRWEELQVSGQVVSVDQFAAQHCGDAPPDLIAKFKARARGLLSADADLLRLQKEPTRTEEGDTGPAADTVCGLTVGSEPVPGYRLVRRLGKGGAGEVWEATGPGGFPVALKFVAVEGKLGKAEEVALEQVKGLHHPHLLAVFGAWRVGSWLVIASELAERSLADRLQECLGQGHAGISGPELHPYMQDAAKGLDYLNGAGVQHRDVKPANLLLMGGAVKVGDFGLAKLLEETTASHSGSMTVTYAAPEFFEGEVTPHSDQYSLAVSYCELRGGRLPFTGTALKVMKGHTELEPDLSMLPEAERPVVARALHKKPKGRWPSCTAFAKQLAAAVKKAEWLTRQEGRVATVPGGEGFPQGIVSVTVTVVNETGQWLLRIDSSCSAGKYLVSPPAAIPPGQAAFFQVFATQLWGGVRGAVTYQLEEHQENCGFTYDAPLLGWKKYTHFCPEGFCVEQHGGRGFWARVQFIVKMAT
jgi:serine/threonine protein kinase